MDAWINEPLPDEEKTYDESGFEAFDKFSDDEDKKAADLAASESRKQRVSQNHEGDPWYLKSKGDSSSKLNSDNNVDVQTIKEDLGQLRVEGGGSSSCKFIEEVWFLVM